MEDAEFFLPPEILTNEDMLEELNMAVFNDSSLIPNFGLEEKYYGKFYRTGLGFHHSSSGLVSSESDEDDYITDLSRKLACSSLDEPLFGNQKGWTLSTSPQSTLCDLGFSTEGSSRGGSPIGPSRVPSPPSTGDLLYEAARMSSLHLNQVEKLRQIQSLRQSHSLWSTQRSTAGQYTHFNRDGVKPNRYPVQRSCIPVGLSDSAWPALERSMQRNSTPNSTITPPFLDSSMKKRCAGTGVFLPRQINSSTPSKKKTGSSSYLLPDRYRYVHPHSNDLGHFASRNNGGVQAKYNLRQKQPDNLEILLPAEWTY